MTGFAWLLGLEYKRLICLHGTNPAQAGTADGKAHVLAAECICAWPQSSTLDYTHVRTAGLDTSTPGQDLLAMLLDSAQLRRGHRSCEKGCSPHNMCATLIALAQDVEEEEVDVVVQGLVVQEELGQVTQVLAVHLLLLAIHLKHADAAVAVDLLAWRMLQLALAQVAQHLMPLLEEAEVILREVQHL